MNDLIARVRREPIIVVNTVGAVAAVALEVTGVIEASGETSIAGIVLLVATTLYGRSKVSPAGRAAASK